MAVVIVSAGRLTDSRLRTLSARTVLGAAAVLLPLLMAACIGAGYGLARATHDPGAVTLRLDLEQPEVRTLLERVGAMAGRLVQIESEAASLARRLGVTPVSTVLAAASEPSSAGGPLLPLKGLARLESDFARVEGHLSSLTAAALDRELVSMAYPNRMPVAGGMVPVSSHFGARSDPFTGRLARHSGLDIPARHGTPILASGGGRVLSAGPRGAYGLAVVIDHGDGLATLYGHASKLLVRPGDVVLPQQRIALVGSTGRSTGPHLHFEVIRDGVRQEPRRYVAHVLSPSDEAARP